MKALEELKKEMDRAAHRLDVWGKDWAEVYQKAKMAYKAELKLNMVEAESIFESISATFPADSGAYIAAKLTAARAVVVYYEEVIK